MLSAADCERASGRQFSLNSAHLDGGPLQTLGGSGTFLYPAPGTRAARFSQLAIFLLTGADIHEEIDEVFFLLLSRKVLGPYIVGSEHSLVTAFLVAQGLRILQDFAGSCRGKCWIFFVFRVSGLTNNLLVSGSNPVGPAKVLCVINRLRSPRVDALQVWSPLRGNKLLISEPPAADHALWSLVNKSFLV